MNPSPSGPDTFTVAMVVLLLVVVGLSLYFLPTTIGRRRGVENQLLLFAVNALFGWSVLGWFGCLMWAIAAQSGTQRRLIALQVAALEREQAVR